MPLQPVTDKLYQVATNITGVAMATGLLDYLENHAGRDLKDYKSEVLNQILDVRLHILSSTADVSLYYHVEHVQQVMTSNITTVDVREMASDKGPQHLVKAKDEKRSRSSAPQAFAKSALFHRRDINRQKDLMDIDIDDTVYFHKDDNITMDVKGRKSKTTENIDLTLTKRNEDSVHCVVKPPGGRCRRKNTKICTLL